MRINHIAGTVAGNAPFLVSREHGMMFPTGTAAAPFEKRVREAEEKLRAHLQSQRSR
jgi:hypothetical protein